MAAVVTRRTWAPWGWAAAAIGCSAHAPNRPSSAKPMVLLCWCLNGERHAERVPLGLARHRHAQLQTQGAVVYWSERLALMP